MTAPDSEQQIAGMKAPTTVMLPACATSDHRQRPPLMRRPPADETPRRAC